MKVHEIMSTDARCTGPDNTLVEAAGLMRVIDVGALPVCENDRLVGMITDRDIVLRAVADGRASTTTPVREVMSPGVTVIMADQEVEEAARLMEEQKIRRLPVLNRERRLVGILSLGDVAVSSQPAFSGMALKEVSEPASPNAQARAFPTSARRVRSEPGEGGDASLESRGNRTRSRQANARANRSGRSKSRRASAVRSGSPARQARTKRRPAAKSAGASQTNRRSGRRGARAKSSSRR